MKLSQKLAILIKNLYLSKQYGTGRLLSELPDKGRKHGSIDSLLKRIRKTGTIVRQPGSSRPRSECSSGGPCAQSEGQARKAPMSS